MHSIGIDARLIKSDAALYLGDDTASVEDGIGTAEETAGNGECEWREKGKSGSESSCRWVNKSGGGWNIKIEESDGCEPVPIGQGIKKAKGSMKSTWQSFAINISLYRVGLKCTTTSRKIDLR